MLHPTGWAAQPFENIYNRVFFKGGENLWGHNTVFISDECERVKKLQE